MKLTQDEILELQVLVNREIDFYNRASNDYEFEKKKLLLISEKLKNEWVRLDR